MKTVRHTPTLVRLTRLGAVNAFLVVEDDGLTLVDTMLPAARTGSSPPPRELGLPIVADRAHARARRPRRLARRARRRPAERDGRGLRARRALPRRRQERSTRASRCPSSAAATRDRDPPGPSAEPGRPRRLARGRRRPRPHAGPGGVPRHARPHADRRRRLLDARRRRDHGEGQSALPAAWAGHVGQADRAPHRARRCARSTRRASPWATATSSRRPARRWTRRSPARGPVSRCRARA